MSKRDFAVLGIRLLAIYACLQALEMLAGGALGLIMQQMMSIGSLTVAGVVCILSPAVVFLGIGFGLFRFSQPIADHLLPSLDSKGSEPPSDSRTLAVIAFGAAGLIGFFMAVPRAVQLWVRWFQILHREDSTPLMRSDTFYADLGLILGTTAQFVLAFALIIGAKRFAAWWWKRQNLEP